jgi:hypothetical protein
MKAKVIKPFKDKRTKVTCNPGQDIEVTQERYEELTSAASGPFVQAIGEPKEPTTKKPATKKSTTKKNKK